MTAQKAEQKADRKVTIDQIGRLERALLALRESAAGSPDVLDTIARIQYREIVRLRSELDVALGVDAGEACDLMITLRGPNVGLGATPASVIASTMDNLRGAVQAVLGYLVTGRPQNKGRFPESISQAADLRLAGVSAGSVRIKLNLPDSATPMRNHRETAERSVRLMLDAIAWASQPASHDARLGELEALIMDQRLSLLLLAQIQRIIPSRRGIVQQMEFSGRLANPMNEYVLSYSSAEKIKDALSKISAAEVRVSEQGKIKAVDFDKRTFELRERPFRQPNLRCVLSRETEPAALYRLSYAAPVIVEGLQKFDALGNPSTLVADAISHAIPAAKNLISDD